MKEFKKILLYPGGFKPFHDGHLMLLKNAIYYNNIDEVWILTGGKPRDKVSAELVSPIINSALTRLSEIFNIETEYNIFSVSPVERCYYLTSHGPDNFIYSMLTSNKENDLERAESFYNGYKVGGKYNQDIWDHDRAFMLNPKTYRKMTYYESNDYISATSIRESIYSDDYTEFLRGYKYMLSYGYVTLDILKKFWIAMVLKTMKTIESRFVVD